MADVDFVEGADPAAEFLAREQENLAGLEDEFEISGGKVNLNGTQEINQLISEAVSGEDEPPLNGFNNGLSYENGSRENQPEPEKIKIWREEQQRLLEEKDREEEKRKEELGSNAKKELEEWYARYAEQLEKSKVNNRTAEKEWIAERDAETPGAEWEKIAKMCDFNPKAVRNTKDTTRMRSILLQLKQTPPVRRDQSGDQ
jgi:hypothetical protein